jgi:hypothetical protein
MAKTVTVRKAAKNDKLPVLREQYDQRTKYDWLSARKDYIEGYEDAEGTIVYPGPKEISERYGIPYGNVTTFISKERWKDHRDAHMNEIALARQKEHSKVLAKKAVKFDEQAADAAQVGQELILGRLLELRSFRAADRARAEDLLERMEQGEIIPVTEFKSLLWHTELESLANSLDKFQNIGRKALGITDNDSTTVNHVEITQTNIGTEMARTDQNRAEGIMQLLANKNLNLPELQQMRDAQYQSIIQGEIEGSTDADDEDFESPGEDED